MSFLNRRLAHKEAFTKFDEIIAKARKEYLPKMDFTTQQAFSAIIEELSTIYSAQASLANTISEQRKEIEIELKEKEKKQKMLAKDGETLEKSWITQLDALKKARANYVRLGKEAQAMGENLEKKKQDPKTKPETVSQLSSKTMAAAEKRDQAEEQYKSILDATNAKMETYYATEQPKLIEEYRSFEEERVIFMREQMDKGLQTIRGTHLADVFNSSCSKIETSVGQIDPSADANQWADQNGKHVCIPDAIPFLTYDTDGGVAPEISCSSAGRKPSGGGGTTSLTSRPAAAIPQSNSSHNNSGSHGKLKKSKSKTKTSKSKSSKSKSSVFDPAKYNVSVTDPEKIPGAASEMLKIVEKDLKKAEKDLAAANKLLEMYDKDPAGRADVEGEVAAAESVVKQLQEIKADLENAASGDIAEASSETRIAAYDYAATNDTELTFKEGDRLQIIQKVYLSCLLRRFLSRMMILGGGLPRLTEKRALFLPITC
jgi:hypothetical protein